MAAAEPSVGMGSEEVLDRVIRRGTMVAIAGIAVSFLGFLVVAATVGTAAYSFAKVSERQLVAEQSDEAAAAERRLDRETQRQIASLVDRLLGRVEGMEHSIEVLERFHMEPGPGG